jgi:hypothetical protein
MKAAPTLRERIDEPQLVKLLEQIADSQPKTTITVSNTKLNRASICMIMMFGSLHERRTTQASKNEPQRSLYQFGLY